MCISKYVYIYIYIYIYIHNTWSKLTQWFAISSDSSRKGEIFHSETLVAQEGIMGRQWTHNKSRTALAKEFCYEYLDWVEEERDKSFWQEYSLNKGLAMYVADLRLCQLAKTRSQSNMRPWIS